MSERPRFIVLATDSFFSAAAFEAIAEHHQKNIALVVLSQATTHSRARLGKVFRTASRRYLWYRSTIQLIGATPIGKSNRIEKLCEELGVAVMTSREINSDREVATIAKVAPAIGIALNFDQILGKEILELFDHGVVNSHAGKLPSDRGISPALWAFARGDGDIWVTVYRMDQHLDSGPIYHQIAVQVEDYDSAFSMYHRVSQTSGQLLERTVREIIDNDIVAVPQTGEPSRPHSWPDRNFARQLRQSKRQMITLADYITMLRR